MKFNLKEKKTRVSLCESAADKLKKCRKKPGNGIKTAEVDVLFVQIYGGKFYAFQN